MKCKRCGTELRKDALFCHECGQPKDGPLKCLNCGAELQENQRFCPSCGTSIYQEIENIQKEKPKKTFIEDVELIEKHQFDDETQEYLGSDIKKFFINNKYKLIIIILFTVQMVLFGGNLVETSMSGYGEGYSELHKLSDLIKYPTTLFYCCNIVAILIICIDIFKHNLFPKIIYKLPFILNLVYPIVCIINFINIDDTTAGLMNFDVFGVNVSTYPTMQGIILIVSIIAIIILSIIDLKHSSDEEYY